MNNELAAWSSFYVTIGASAASLTGLTFVVITLITSMERMPAAEGLAVFSTPTVLHFGTALLIAAILSAPWHSAVTVAIFLAIVGACGLVYIISIMYRTRRLRVYDPDLSDWIWYTIVPFIAYAAILAGGLMFVPLPVKALFIVGGAALLLIFVGIRNSWDVVTFLIARDAGERSVRPDEDKS